MGQLKDRGVLGAANLQTKFKNISEIIWISSRFKFKIEIVCTIWDSRKTGGPWERDICKRNSKTFLKIVFSFPFSFNRKSFDFHRDSSLRLKLFSPYGTAQRRGGLGSGISAKKIQKCCENCALIRSLKLKIQVFDHNFTRSARIELRFWEVANLEKLNNFCHGHF